MGGSLVVFADGVREGRKEEEYERKKVLLPAFLVPKYPGSSLMQQPFAFQCPNASVLH